MKTGVPNKEADILKLKCVSVNHTVGSLRERQREHGEKSGPSCSRTHNLQLPKR